jgi:Tol biopolymer transport system component
MKGPTRSLCVAIAGFAVAGAVSILFMTPLSMTAQPGYSEWSAPVNLGPVINSSFDENAPTLSKNGLSLYFQSNKSGGLGGADIYVSQRNSVDEPWGVPINITPVNSTVEDAAPNLSRDGHWLFFMSMRTPSLGGFDLWVSYREHVHNDLDWQPPVNLGPILNSTSFDQSPFFFDNDDAGLPQLFFSRTIQGFNHFFVSNRLPDGTFTPPTLVTELNSSGNDRGISVRSDGLEVFLMSTRSGGFGLQDLWTATRHSATDPWSTPVSLGPLVNSTAGDLNPYIASDRETLYFNSNRLGSGFGGQDLYVSTRTK